IEQRRKRNWLTHTKRPRNRLQGPFAIAGKARLLDLGFLEFDVLADDGVVLLERQLFSLGASVLLGHVEEAGIGSRHELDLDGGGFCHSSRSFTKTKSAASRGSAGIWPQPTDLPPVVKTIALSGGTGNGRTD